MIPERRRPAPPPQDRPRRTRSAAADASRPDDTDQLDLFAGRDAAEEATDAWWLSNAMQALHAEAATGREFQCYDLVVNYGIAEPDSAKRWGALLGRAARQGVIVAVGVARSKRPSAAGALCRVWRGAA